MRSITKCLLVAWILLAIGGCSLAPAYRQPDLPVAADLQASRSSVGPSVGDQSPMIGPELNWREYFTDHRLQHLIEAALAGNRDLRVSALNVEAYQAQYRIQRAALLPAIGGEGLSRKQRTLSGSDHATSEVYAASVGITAYELDLFGRVRSLKDKALEQYLAMEATHRSARLSLVAEVARGYLTWLADLELLAITEDTLRVEE